MNKLAYIATILYLPLTIVYAQFYHGDNPLIWNKYFFALDKIYIAMLLLTLIDKEILIKRRLIYFAGLGLVILFIGYILIDWREVYNYDKLITTIYCSIGILFYIFVLIRKRNDSPNKR